jgi:hypothetical protein
MVPMRPTTRSTCAERPTQKQRRSSASHRGRSSGLQAEALPRMGRQAAQAAVVSLVFSAEPVQLSAMAAELFPSDGNGKATLRNRKFSVQKAADVYSCCTHACRTNIAPLDWLHLASPTGFEPVLSP